MDDELSEDRKDMSIGASVMVSALNLFEYNSTLAAKIALGHGVDRETVAMVLRSLADAIETQDCAENMSPIDDQNTFEELFID